MLPPLPAFLIGLALAPLAGKMIKPVARGVIRTFAGVALELRSTAARTVEELEDLAAEAKRAEPERKPDETENADLRR